MGHMPGAIRWLIFRGTFLIWIVRQRRSFDLLLLRHNVHDPLQTLFLLIFGRRTVLVHHTKEIEELLSLGGLISGARARLERWFGKLSIRLAAGVVAVTPEILAYEIARGGRQSQFGACYPNAIQLSDPHLDDHRGDTPYLIFIASTFDPWHGLDLLIESASETRESFEVHLVGHVPESLRTLVETDRRFIAHGILNRTGILALGEQAWLGISSMAAERKGLEQGCALKVREYLSWGVPVAGAYVEVLPEGFPFYSRIKPEMSSVLKVARAMRKTPRKVVQQAAASHISKQSVLHRLAEDLQAFDG
jgi:glycosyltransferase involved in cell wall biosynthesis